MRVGEVLRSIAKWLGIGVGCVVALFVLVAGWPTSLLLVFVGLIVYGIIRLRAEHLMNRVWWTGSRKIRRDPPSRNPPAHKATAGGGYGGQGRSAFAKATADGVEEDHREAEARG